ncbi:MAG: FAD:protein FMN transferase [Pseudomonadota bacterium]
MRLTATTPAFGTTIEVSVAHANRREAELAIEDALDAATGIARLLSAEAPESQLFRLNRDRRLERPDAHLLALLGQARALSELTRGAFDITAQRVRQEAPRARSNWSHVDFDCASARLKKPGMAITLNGLAPGYAADLALAAMRARGVVQAVLKFLHPRIPGATVALARTDGRCEATSGNYEASFNPDLVQHGVLDPGTGESPQELASVTVLAASGSQADGLSTAFMVMGARKAHALAARLPGVDILTINKRGVVWKSPNFSVSGSPI